MRQRWVLGITLLSILAIAVLIGLWVLLVDKALNSKDYAALVLGHFPAIIGLPMAAIAAFVLVAYLKQKPGEGITFKALGIEFSGPSGEAILWVICFMSITLAIKLLW